MNTATSEALIEITVDATSRAPFSAALAEPVPAAAPVVAEPRIDLLVNNAQAREVFLAIVADTRYSMLMHPDVSGKLSVTLRGVTVPEALEAIRDVYGYDFKIEGRRITVYAPTLQTRIFTINYPHSQRSGSSDSSWPAATAITIWMPNARLAPIHTHRRGKRVARTSVAMNDLSGSSAGKITRNVASSTARSRVQVTSHSPITGRPVRPPGMRLVGRSGMTTGRGGVRGPLHMAGTASMRSARAYAALS